MGKLALAAAPALALLPQSETLSQPEVMEISQLSAATLRSWEKEIAEIRPHKDADGALSYSRAQVAQILRIKHLALIEKLPLAEIRSRVLSAPERARPAALPAARSTGAGESAAPARPAPPASGVLPASTIAFLSAELQALINLCDETE